MSKRKITLSFLIDPQTGRYHIEEVVSDKEDVLIGSGDDCDIQIPDGRRAGISRKHLIICPYDKPGPTISDQNSRYGTYLNGHRIAPITKHPIKNKDSFGLGDIYTFDVNISREREKVKRSFLYEARLKFYALRRGYNGRKTKTN